MHHSCLFYGVESQIKASKSLSALAQSPNRVYGQSPQASRQELAHFIHTGEEAIFFVDGFTLGIFLSGQADRWRLRDGADGRYSHEANRL